MRVDETIDLGSGHLIELGAATWDENEHSIRDRWPTRTGGFSPHSSSEVPIASLAPMLAFAASRDRLSVNECLTIIRALIDSVERQTNIRQ